MKTKLVLDAIEKNIGTILKELDTEEVEELRAVLAQVVAAEGPFTEALNSLEQLCLNSPVLEKLVSQAEADSEPPIVFRGRPVPVSLTEESKRVRLLANRLIDAIDKSPDKTDDR